MKKNHKLFSVVLAILMLVPILASFSVMADTTETTLAFVAYNDATDGQLLYHANFKGGDGVWTTEESGKGATIEKNDGESVQLENKHAAGLTVWGSKTPYPLDNGNSYTVTFTLDTPSHKQPGAISGFYMDGNTGFVVYPNGEAWEIRQGKKTSKANGSYEGLYSGSGAQTFAIEFDDFYTYEVQTGEGEAATTTTKRTCKSCILYVKTDTGAWAKLHEMTEEELKYYDFYSDFRLYFYLYNDYSVIFSDVNLYKGVSYVKNNGGVMILEPPVEDKDDKTYDAPELIEDPVVTPEPKPETEKKGCGASIAFQGALFMIASATVFVGMSLKKKKFD